MTRWLLVTVLGLGSCGVRIANSDCRLFKCAADRVCKPRPGGESLGWICAPKPSPKPSPHSVPRTAVIA